MTNKTQPISDSGLVEAFESRRIPSLDLKRTEDGSYRYEAARMAFRDFCDGWHAALSVSPDLMQLSFDLLAILNRTTTRETTRMQANDIMDLFRPYLRTQPAPQVSEDVLRGVLVGGNHLASALNAISDPLRIADYDDALHKHGQPYADMWAAWQAIGELAAALQLSTKEVL